MAQSRAAQRTVSDVPDSEYRPTKRRKVVSLNARFDRMIKSVDTMLSYRTSSPASSRRIQSSGTSSISSHDLPKTPVDAYSNLYPGKLGNDFSVLKMKSSLPLNRNDADGFPKPAAPPKELRGPLPDWLADTFCSLEADHPLRGLLSPSRIHTDSKSNSPSVEIGASREEKVFAFSPFDKQEEAYRADNALNAQQHFSPVVPIEPSLLHSELEAPTEPLPFSTPGCFAPARRPTQRSIVDSTFQKSLVRVPQRVASYSTNTMQPLSHLHPDDVIERQFIFSNLQENGENAKRHCHALQSGCDNLNIYVTPGPTFACSRPVYFDSPTEDPSLSDPLQPESYELDLNAIDFRWRPFLRSNAPESDVNGRSVSSSSPLGYTIPDREAVDNQGGWDARFPVHEREYGASCEDLPSVADEVEILSPGNVHVATTKSSAINNPTRPWSSQIDDIQKLKPALLVAPHVWPRGGEENLRTSEEFLSLHGEEVKTFGSEAHGMRPSTPIRQVAVSPPNTPQKLRSSQLCEIPRAQVRKTSSAVSWMIPLKHSKHTVAVRGEADRRLFHVSENNSHDSIESRDETG